MWPVTGGFEGTPMPVGIHGAGTWARRGQGGLGRTVLGCGDKALQDQAPSQPAVWGREGALPPELSEAPGGSRQPSPLCPVVAWPPASWVFSSRAPAVGKGPP